MIKLKDGVSGLIIFGTLIFIVSLWIHALRAEQTFAPAICDTSCEALDHILEAKAGTKG